MKTTIAFLATILLASPAFAATLHSPSVLIASGERLDCLLRNVANKDITNVSVDSTVGGNGGGVGSPALSPGSTVSAGIPNTEVGAARGWCEFEFKGGRKAVRASLCIRPGTSASCTAVTEVVR